LFLQEFGQGDELGLADAALEGQAAASDEVVDQLQRNARAVRESHC
jgi:hypothetical protein